MNLKYNKEHPLRLATLCSGYDAQALAMKRLKQHFPDFDYDLVLWSEVEMNAIAAHNAIFSQWKDRNMGDCSVIDWDKAPDFDMLFYSTPCQDISNAGLQRGLDKGSGTRSSLIWCVEDAIKAKCPPLCVLENVKALVSNKFLSDFQHWLEILESYGYTNYWHIMDASEYGVPQHRERVFCVSILNDGSGQTFLFPKSFPLTKCLGDVLEDKVDESYYLTDKALKYFKRVNDDTSHGHKFTPKKNETPHLLSDVKPEAELTITSMQKSNTELASKFKELLQGYGMTINGDTEKILTKLNERTNIE